MKSPMFTRLLTVVALMMIMCQPLYSQQEATGSAHDDWNAGCEDVAERPRKCAIWQVIATAADGPRLLHVELSFYRPVSGADETELLLILPLGISLHTDPSLHIEGRFAANFKVDYCVSDGCYLRTTISDQLLEQLLRMSSASLKVQSSAGESISLPISGTGSRAAFNSTE